jgi:hypothetical protein
METPTPVEYISPSALAKLDDITVRADLVSAAHNYEEDPKRFGTEGELRLGKKTCRVAIKGETVSDGIVPFSWSMKGKTGTSYSIIVEISDEDVDGIEFIISKIQDFLDTQGEQYADWSVTSPLRGEKLTIKLKATDKKFDPKFNAKKIDTKNYANIGLEMDQQVAFEGTIEPQFKFADKRVDLNYIVKRVYYTPVNVDEPVTKRTKV